MAGRLTVRSTPRGDETLERRLALGAIGRAITRMRAERGLSQEQASERCGFHRTYLGSIERGRKNPPTTTLLRIAQVLECKASELLSEAGF